MKAPKSTPRKTSSQRVMHTARTARSAVTPINSADAVKAIQCLMRPLPDSPMAAFDEARRHAADLLLHGCNIDHQFSVAVGQVAAQLGEWREIDLDDVVHCDELEAKMDGAYLFGLAVGLQLVGKGGVQ